MPYKNRQDKREYQRIWIAQRRAEYLRDKKCANCGATRHLEIDHKDPNKKWTHRFWSYCEAKRLRELKKCQILCHDCHMEKTSKESGKTWNQIYTDRGCVGCCCWECRGVTATTTEEFRQNRKKTT